MLRPAHKTPRASVRDRLREEDGMTLVELLIGMVAATFVIGAAFTAMTAANNAQVRTEYRLDSLSRARGGMERITRDIRAQQCLGNINGVDNPAIQWASRLGLQFYSSVAGATANGQPLERRRIEWLPNTDPQFMDGGLPTGDIWETVWRSPQTAPPYTWPATPLNTQIIAEDVEAPSAADPIFTYFAFPAGDIDIARPTDKLAFGAFDGAASLNPRNTPSLSVANAARVVVIKVDYVSRSKRNKVAKSAPVPFSNTVSVRTADPTRPGQSPLC